jgi:hypothetical protein
MKDESSEECSTHGKGDYIFTSKSFIGKHKGKRPLLRLRRNWEDNIKMYLSEIGWEGVEWILLAQDRNQ